jgi:hypothetical protein
MSQEAWLEITGHFMTSYIVSTSVYWLSKSPRPAQFKAKETAYHFSIKEQQRIGAIFFHLEVGTSRGQLRVYAHT